MKVLLRCQTCEDAVNELLPEMRIEVSTIPGIMAEDVDMVISSFVESVRDACRRASHRGYFRPACSADWPKRIHPDPDLGHALAAQAGA